MNTDFIKGIIPPIVTPITEDENLDIAVLRNHIEFMIDGGIDGILAFGSNGEFYMLEEEEMAVMLKIIIEQTNGRVPVYMGIGAIRTSKCLRLARLAAENGVQGISILPPMFIRPTEDELCGHFSTIAQSVPDIPVLLYNNPGRIGYCISQNVVERLAHSLQNLVGMKDSSGDLTETMEYIRRNRDVNFKVLVGKDTLVYSGFTVGTVGAVCATANYVPELVCSIYDKFAAGDLKGSLEAQFQLNPIRLLIDKTSFPVAVKDYANVRGHFVGKPFLPNKPADAYFDRFKQALINAQIDFIPGA
jgi:4-hydroxy-tetrahydrodipicolinate synthase